MTATLTLALYFGMKYSARKLHFLLEYSLGICCLSGKAAALCLIQSMCCRVFRNTLQKTVLPHPWHKTGTTRGVRQPPLKLFAHVVVVDLATNGRMDRHATIYLAAGMQEHY